MGNEENNIGFMKYKGSLVEDGYLDARKSAQALLGFDEAVRFFIYQQFPDLRKIDFEFPVKVKKGSWEIVIPELLSLGKIAGGLIATAYGMKAAQKMAERDFNDIGLKDVFQKSLIGIQWVIKIRKHLGDLTLKKFDNAKFKDDNTIIGIKNSDGEYLYVPKEYLDFYVSSNPKILSKLAELIEEERFLIIGVYQDDGFIEESVTRKYRRIFTSEEDKDELLFPELVHGAPVRLEGELTRGNEMSNNVGFAYQGHILTCIPESGSIVRFKSTLFLKCRIEGSITRMDDKGMLSLIKPKIIFSHIEPIEKDLNESTLL